MLKDNIPSPAKLKNWRDIEQKGKSSTQIIKFISYAYFQTEVKKKTLTSRSKPTSKKNTKKPEKNANRPDGAPGDIPDWMFEPITESMPTTEPSKEVKQKPLTKKKKSQPVQKKKIVFHDIAVLDLKVCKNVRNNLPLEPGSTFTTDIGRIYCHSLLDNNSGKTNDVYHIWYFNGQLKAKVRIRIPDGKELPAISHREIGTDDKGTWKIEITDDDKKILDTVIFELV